MLKKESKKAKKKGRRERNRLKKGKASLSGRRLHAVSVRPNFKLLQHTGLNRASAGQVQPSASSKVRCQQAQPTEHTPSSLILLLVHIHHHLSTALRPDPPRTPSSVRPGTATGRPPCPSSSTLPDP